MSNPSPDSKFHGLAVGADDLAALGITDPQPLVAALGREVDEHPERNVREWLLKQARAYAIQHGLLDGYRHMDSQESFWERMETLGHRPRPHDQPEACA